MNSSELTGQFENLIKMLKSKTIFATMGDDPVYYFVFPPGDSLLVKRKLNVFDAKLKYEGWNPLFFSLGGKMHQYILQDEAYEEFVEYEREHPFDFYTVNESIKERLDKGGRSVLYDWVMEKLEEAKQLENGILILTDIELLHPYEKIGRIEAHLQGKVNVPIVVMYPGKRTSRYGLKFLDFYPPDGNYRSIHIGGDA